MEQMSHGSHPGSPGLSMQPRGTRPREAFGGRVAFITGVDLVVDGGWILALA